MHSNTNQLRQFVQEKPLTSFGGALLVGFAFGSGAAMPILLGAGLSQSGVRQALQSWLLKEAEMGLRQWLQPQPPVPTQECESSVEDHGQSDSGYPGETGLARKVCQELAGYACTEERVSQAVLGDETSL